MKVDDNHWKPATNGRVADIKGVGTFYANLRRTDRWNGGGGEGGGRFSSVFRLVNFWERSRRDDNWAALKRIGYSSGDLSPERVFRLKTVPCATVFPNGYPSSPRRVAFTRGFRNTDRAVHDLSSLSCKSSVRRRLIRDLFPGPENRTDSTFRTGIGRKPEPTATQNIIGPILKAVVAPADAKRQRIQIPKNPNNLRKRVDRIVSIPLLKCALNA